MKLNLRGIDGVTIPRRRRFKTQIRPRRFRKMGIRRKYTQAWLCGDRREYWWLIFPGKEVACIEFGKPF